MHQVSKIQLIPIGNYSEEYQYWKNLNEKVFQISNIIVREQLFNESLDDRILFLHDEIAKRTESCIKNKNIELSKATPNFDLLNKYDKELLKLKSEAQKRLEDFFIKGRQNSTYTLISNLFEIPSYISSALNNQIVNKIKKEKFEREIGKRSFPYYKKNRSIPFMKNSMKFTFDGKDHIITLWENKNLKLNFGRDRSNNRIKIERLLLGEYKLADSEILLRNGKIILSIVLDIPNVQNELDENIVVGVDLGINIPLYLALNEGYSKLGLGSREEFLNRRGKIIAMRRRLQSSLILTNGGKGRGKKLKALDRLSETERNFVNTYNHNLSKQVIKFALDNKAATIHLEDLSNFGKNKENEIKPEFNFLLSRWSYYELQKMIEYKATKENIKVKYIVSAYTSQTCSWCGNLEKNQRIDQSSFQCKNPNCNNKDKENVNIIVNADYNAARNIAKSVKFSKI